MADFLRIGSAERDVEQAITALKKGACLLKYGRRGKPKFCPFRLSGDESLLVWYSGKVEKHVILSQVSKIIPGQRTAIFQRYPRPEKEYQSFSLIYSDRSLDLICKDKDEAEVWFVALKALISRGNYPKWNIGAISDSVSSDSLHIRTRRSCPSPASSDPGDNQNITDSFDTFPHNGITKAYSDIALSSAAPKSPTQSEFSHSLNSLVSEGVENTTGRSSAAETCRVSLSSAISSSSHGSYREDFDAFGDVFMWGECIGDGMLGGGTHRIGSSSSAKMDTRLPKALESTVVLDVQNIACGSEHAVVVTKQGEIFSWGEESGGRLGHGEDADVSHPKLIDTLSGMNIEHVACGEYHTCAVTLYGDLYTWGDGTHNSGLLGNGSEVSHWIPKKLTGNLEGIHVSYIACGPWHTAALASSGQLFTFGEGAFGVLGHGDHISIVIPREVETLRGSRTVKVACGVWHTAAVVEASTETASSGQETGSGRSPRSSAGNLFTWGDGNKGQLGHGDIESRLFPQCVAAVVDENICQVACGNNLTVALTSSGQVYSMGSPEYGQLGNPTADGKTPTCVQNKSADCFVEIACGSYHVAILTSKAEVYTWGKGTNGQLGHGDNDSRSSPALVEFLKDKQVKSVACGKNFTAAICLHKWVSSADHQAVCSGCHSPFGFRRKRHNCYNCGLVFCKACSSKKSLKASLAPTMNKPYRVCDNCFTKLKKFLEFESVGRIPKSRSRTIILRSNEVVEKEVAGPKLQRKLSRLCSSKSLNLADNNPSNCETTTDLNDTCVFPSKKGILQLGGYHSLNRSTAPLVPSKKVSFASVPGSKVASRATSPAPGVSTPSQSTIPSPYFKFSTPEVIFDYESLSQEVKNLRTQVEDLTKKSQHLEAKLERTSKQLKDVTATAADEAEKYKASKEQIKSLTAQYKELAERTSAGHICSCHPGFSANSKSSSVASGKSTTTARHASNLLEALCNDSHVLTPNPPESESNGGTEDSILPNGTKEQTRRAEWVVHDEAGVHITLSALPGGGNELIRVRFSRKRFTEGQAEQWWTENVTRVCERHDIRSRE